MALALYDELYEARANGIPIKRLCMATGVDFVELNAKMRDQTFTEDEEKKISSEIKVWKNDIGQLIPKTS